MSEENRPANSLAARSARAAAAVRTTPVWSCNVTLNTDYAQRVYRRYYDHVRGDLFILTVRTRATGLDEAAGVLEGMLSEEFGALRKDLQDELGRTEAMMEQVKLDRVPAYEGAQSFQAQYSTPRAKEYLDVIVQMDQLLVNYDALWLTGYIETHARVNRSQNWQRRLIKVANRLRELGNRTKGGIQREIDRRTQRRQNPDDAAADAASTSAEGATPPVAVETDPSLALVQVGADEEGRGADVDDDDLLDDSGEGSSTAEDLSLSSSNAERGVATELHAQNPQHNELPADATSIESPADVHTDTATPSNGAAPARKTRRGNSAAAPAGEHGLLG